MKALVKTAVVALVLGVAAPASSSAHAQSMMGMMGGNCPTMGMMGQGMMNQGMMGQGMMGQGMMNGGMMGQGMMDWQPNMDAVAIGHLAYLEAELGIADSQKAAWTAYANEVKDEMAVMQGVHQAMMSAMHDGTMVERMDAHIGAMQAMVDAMTAIKPAAEKLYAVLSDEQRRKADMLLGMGCGGM